MIRHYLLFPFSCVRSLLQHINFKYKAFRELMFILLSILIFLFFTFVQLSIIELSQSLYISVDSISDFFLGLFQVQATISTLGIAVISIISGVLSAKYYGVQVTDYILNLRPRILKHKTSVSIGLLFLLLYYLFFSLRIYNICSAIFICSILLCIRMFSEIYSVFSRVASYKEVIKDFLLEDCFPDRANFSELGFRRVLQRLQSDLEATITNENFTNASDDVYLLIDIAEQCTLLYKTNEFERTKMEPREFLRDTYKAFSCLKYSDNDKFFCLYISSLARIINMYTRAKTTVDFWSSISANFFSKVSLSDPTILFADGSIRVLRVAIFANLTENIETWYGAIDFLSSLYNALRVNEKYIILPILTKQRLWESLVVEDTVSKSNYSPMTETHSLQKARKEELNQLYKVIIDNEDFEIFYSIFPIEHCEYVDLNLATMIHLYDTMLTKQSFDKLLAIHLKVLASREMPLHTLPKCINKEQLIKRINDALHYLKRNWNNPYDSDQFYLRNSAKEKEFIFYYILYQSKSIKSIDIFEVIDLCSIYSFTDFEDLCCHKHYVNFDKKYKTFLQFLLGQSNIDYEENTSHAFNICKELIEL